MNITLKRTIVVIPFLAMLVDILSWFAARSITQFAYVVVGAVRFHPSLNMQVSDQLKDN